MKIPFKKPLHFKNTLKPLNFLGLTLAGVINAAGVTLFLMPAQIFDGGLSGTSQFLASLTPQLTISIFLLILNVPFYLFGLKKQGLVFTVYSIYAIAVYSLFAFIFQTYIPMENGVSPITNNDMLLSALFGGLISGIGSGLTIRFGGAIDGIDVLAVVCAKYIGMTVGSFVMIYNVILFLSIAFTLSSYVIPLYSILAYAVGVKSIDFVVSGFDKAKAANIVTEKGEEMAKNLSEGLGRGITVLEAKGYYSKQNKTMLYCVINRFQIGKLKSIVQNTDTGAFVTISDISDTFGTSVKLARFSYMKKKDAPNVETIDACKNEPKENAQDTPQSKT